MTKSVTKCATTSSTSHARKFIIDYSRVQCVTLDVTGTLISFRRQVGEVYASAISHCGLRSSSSASEKHDAQRLQACFWGAFCHIHETLPHVGGDEISTREWWKMVVDRTFADAKYHNFNTEDLAKIFDKVYEDYGRADSYNLFPDVKPFLLRARSNGLKLGVISNESERYSEEILPQFGLNEHFDFIVLAKMAKASKPDPAIFKVSRPTNCPSPHLRSRFTLVSAAMALKTYTIDAQTKKVRGEEIWGRSRPHPARR